MKFSSALIATFVVVTFIAAESTFSIAAIDTRTGQIGSAGSSCVVGHEILPTVFERLHHPVKGKGVFLTQAKTPFDDSLVYGHAAALLAMEEDPVSIIKNITDPSVDPDDITGGDDEVFRGRELRQYGIVDLEGRTNGYTGESIKPYYYSLGMNEFDFQNYTQQDIQGKVGHFSFSAQGNIVSLNTVPSIADTFIAGGCDLAERLYNALIVVDELNTQANRTNSSARNNFEGDVRCKKPNIFANGFPGLQAYVHVEDLQLNTLMQIEWITKIEVDGSVDLTIHPFDELRKQYADARAVFKCPGSIRSRRAV